MTSASSFWQSLWSASPMKAWTGSANAKYLVRWEWCALRTIRRHRGRLRFLLRPMTAHFGSGSSRAKCRMKMPAFSAESRDMPASSRRQKTWQLLLTFFCKEVHPWCVRDSGALHSPGNRAGWHFPGLGLGHAFFALSVRKVFLGAFIWAFGIHGHVTLDRSRTPAFHHDADQPDLAGLQ